MTTPTTQREADEREIAPADVVADLREYASNPGYSHNDYADTMRRAAHCIESLRAMFYHYEKAVIPTAPQAASQQVSSSLTNEQIVEITRPFWNEKIRWFDVVGLYRFLESNTGQASALDAPKAAYWFTVLAKCARLLNLPNDEPIPSGVLRAVEQLAAPQAATTASQPARTQAGRDFDVEQAAKGIEFFGDHELANRLRHAWKVQCAATTASAATSDGEIAAWEGLTDLFGLVAEKHGINDIQVNGGSADELFPRVLAEFIVAASRRTPVQAAQPALLPEPYAYEEYNGRGSELVYAEWFKKGYGKMDPDSTYTALYLAAPGAAQTTDARDAARLEKFIDWYLRGGEYAEINPNGHIVRTTREQIIAWLDRATHPTDKGQTNE